MAQDQFKLRLTAILSADVAGYSRLMGEDETYTVSALKSYRKLIAGKIQAFKGRVIDSPGDNILAAKQSTPEDANKPSIAVLPFANMSDDPQQDYFSDGMAEQLITGLSQSPDSYATARTSIFACKGKSMTAQQISDQLGVRYLLEGSVQRDADRVRINVQLIDGRTGNHFWTDRFDRKFEALFFVQDQII